ncbi:MAG: hypothetical protein ABSA53_07755 [Streptosporangiaceae bacterium]
MDSIVEALLEVDILGDPEGLRMCVELSEQEIGEEIPAMAGSPGSAGKPGGLRDLVGRLRWRDAAMWVFVDTVQDVFGSGEIMDSVRMAVRSLVAEPVLSRGQRQEAHRLCAGAACSNAAELFRVSVGGIGYVLESDAGKIRAVLNELENLPVRSSDGLSPMVVFVELLAGEQPPELAERMRTWVDSCVGDRAPLVQALHEIRDTAPALPDAGPKYCIVQLDVDGVDADRFLVSVMFQENNAPFEPLRPPDDRSYTETEVRNLLGAVLNEPRLAGANDLTIEFFLPGPLINQPVDQWHVGLGDIVLGVQYPIVVRSLDRIRHARNARNVWRAKWTKVSAIEFHDGSTAVDWLSGDPLEQPDRLFVKLTEHAAPVCLLLEATPVPGQCDALLAALRAGIPAVLWSRRPMVDIRAELSTLMPRTGPVRLRELPMRVFQFRREAVANGADKQHLGYHLTLLWDDADRIPDADSPLHMPA